MGPNILREFAPKVAESAESLDVELTWSLACQAVSSMLDAISGSAGVQKGFFPGFQVTPVVNKPKEVALRTKRIARISALFREMIRKASVFESNISFAWRNSYNQTLHKLERELQAVCFPFPEGFLSERKNFSSDFQTFQDWDQKYDQKVKASGLRAWRKKLRISNAADKKLVHRWLKGSFATVPRLMQRSDGSLSGSVSEMLESVSDHMESVYNQHMEWDTPSQIEYFREKYRDSISQTFCEASVPSLNEQDFWDLCQSKSPTKASGLDMWSYRELQQLPVSAWQLFVLVCKLVEAVGEWPNIVKCITVTCLPKKDGPVLNPNQIRAIGVSSVVYSLWSSLRFRHLSTWMNSIAPSCLLGGIPGRSADSHEIDLSLEFHEHDQNPDPIAIFLDRAKCFDMLVPDFAVQIACDIGLPLNVARALTGFYRGQIKIFKIGRFYGRKVFSKNSAIQGCSMSILMVNAFYSIMTRAMTNQFHHVSIATFIDDAKIWGSFHYVDEIAGAFEFVRQFDKDIGQQLNPQKTEILARRVLKGKLLKQKIQLPVQVSSQVKSLGRVQQMNKCRNATMQSNRVAKASDCLKKIRQLPLSPPQKSVYIHAHAHSKWVFGSETQGIPKKDLQKLRTQVCDIFDPSSHNMRSPFAVMAILEDVFLDPFAKWACHVLNHARKLVKFHPNIAKRALGAVLRGPTPKSGACHGFSNVLSYILSELNWAVISPDDFTVSTPHGSFPFSAWSDQYFSGIVASSVRTYLFKQQPVRQETCRIPEGHLLDISLTRFLFDQKMRSDEEFDFLKPHVDKIPRSWAYSKNLLRMAQTGRVFTSSRLHAAGLAPDNLCISCGEKETVRHLFCDCPAYSRTRPAPVEPGHDVTMLTGVVFSAPLQFESCCLTCPERPGGPFFPTEIVFIDGSCYKSNWHQVATAASAYFLSTECNFACLLPTQDCTSQRSEIFAAALALSHSSGPITIASDCLTVVRIFKRLQDADFSREWIHKLDNWDCWNLVCSVAKSRPGRVHIIKVKAHCTAKSSQDPYLTYGNSMVDAAARAVARDAFRAKLEPYRKLITVAVSWQCHIIATLGERCACQFLCPSDQPPSDPTPSHLFPEQCNSEFLTKCENGTVRPNDFDRLWDVYQTFRDSFTSVIVQPHVFPQLDQRNARSRLQNYSGEYFQALSRYTQDVCVEFLVNQQGPKVPWVLVFFDFVGCYPDLPEWVDGKKLQHFLNQFKTRFRCFCKGKFTSYHHCMNLRDLHFGRMSGFVGLFKPVSIHKVTFLSVHSSAQIGYSGGSPSGRGPGVSCRSIDIPFSVLRSFPAFAD